VAKLGHRALELRDRKIDVLHRQRHGADEALWIARHPVCDDVVHTAGKLCRRLRVRPPGRHVHRAGEHDVHVDAALVHVGDLQLRIEKPSQIGARRRLLLAEARDGVAAGAARAQLLVEHVGVEVDHERDVGVFHCGVLLRPRLVFSG
jgi:hypothetical protein